MKKIEKILEKWKTQRVLSDSTPLHLENSCQSWESGEIKFCVGGCVGTFLKAQGHTISTHTLI